MTNDSEFSLFYAHNLTKIYGTFNSRIANIITFIQILFGSSLALDVTKTFPLLSDYHWTFWTGAIVTATAILSFVYKLLAHLRILHIKEQQSNFLEMTTLNLIIISVSLLIFQEILLRTEPEPSFEHYVPKRPPPKPKK